MKRLFAQSSTKNRKKNRKKQHKKQQLQPNLHIHQTSGTSNQQLNTAV